MFLDNQIQDFRQSVRLHYKYADKHEDADFNAKLYVKLNWNPPREDPDHKENLKKIHQELLTNFSNNCPQWKPNISHEELCGLRDLKDHPSVRVLATDKNLSPALVSTEWVEKGTPKHLNDTRSYTKITADEWLIRRHKVIKTRDKLVNSYSHFLFPNLLKFLRSLDNTPRS